MEFLDIPPPEKPSEETETQEKTGYAEEQDEILATVASSLSLVAESKERYPTAGDPNKPV
jgi:hypothetical protein